MKDNAKLLYCAAESLRHGGTTAQRQDKHIIMQDFSRQAVWTSEHFESHTQSIKAMV